MTPLERAIAAFEYRFTKVIEFNGGRGVVKAGNNISQAAPGEPFIIFGAGGRLSEGARHLEDVKTEAEAIDGFFRDANAYADECRDQGKTVLIWRVMPETEFGGGHKKGDHNWIADQPFEDDQPDYWMIYGRLVIVSPDLLTEAA